MIAEKGKKNKGEWIAAKGKKNNKKGKQEPTPEKNPFMFYSDFKEGCRFPINRSKEASHRNFEDSFC